MGSFLSLKKKIKTNSIQIINQNTIAIPNKIMIDDPWQQQVPEHILHLYPQHNDTIKQGMLIYRTSSAVKQCHARIFGHKQQPFSFAISECIVIALGKNWENIGMPNLIKGFVYWNINILEAPGSKQIEHILFPRLKTLTLQAVSVASIEGIANIYMPFVSSLSITMCNLISVRSVRRLNLPHLNHFQLSSIFLMQLDRKFRTHHLCQS